MKTLIIWQPSGIKLHLMIIIFHLLHIKLFYGDNLLHLCWAILLVLCHYIYGRKRTVKIKSELNRIEKYDSVDFTSRNRSRTQ